MTNGQSTQSRCFTLHSSARNFEAETRKPPRRHRKATSPMKSLGPGSLAAHAALTTSQVNVQVHGVPSLKLFGKLSSCRK